MKILFCLFGYKKRENDDTYKGFDLSFLLKLSLRSAIVKNMNTFLCLYFQSMTSIEIVLILFKLTKKLTLITQILYKKVRLFKYSLALILLII
jgi:hypothetical protein